jgi:hypothetical protein
MTSSRRKVVHSSSNDDVWIREPISSGPVHAVQDNKTPAHVVRPAKSRALRRSSRSGQHCAEGGRLPISTVQKIWFLLGIGAVQYSILLAGLCSR